jgi:ribosomal protein S13
MRICNIEVKNQKVTLFSFLLMIYGINQSSARKVCHKINLAENTRLSDLKSKGLTDVLLTKQLQQAFKDLKLTTGFDLRFSQEKDLKRLKVVNCRR